MKIEFDSRIFEKFPSACVGIIILRNCKNGKAYDEVDSLIKLEEANLRQRFTKDTFQQHDKITCWRKAYSEFGVKPRDGKASIENLVRIIVSGRDLRRDSALVDTYNLISLKYLLPLGAEDLDQIKGDIKLTFAGPNEPKVLLLGDDTEEAPIEGEVIYKDDVSALCRRWNWREADRIKLTSATQNAVFYVEGVSPTTELEVKTALDELADLLEKFNCGVVEKKEIANSINRVIQV